MVPWPLNFFENACPVMCTLVSIFVQLFFRETSNTIDLNSTEVNYSFPQESVMIPLAEPRSYSC